MGLAAPTIEMGATPIANDSHVLPIGQAFQGPIIPNAARVHTNNVGPNRELIVRPPLFPQMPVNTREEYSMSPEQEAILKAVMGLWQTSKDLTEQIKVSATCKEARDLLNGIRQLAQEATKYLKIRSNVRGFPSQLKNAGPVPE